jgi:N6-adenosine-specific RNA methylase IME4
LTTILTIEQYGGRMATLLFFLGDYMYCDASDLTRLIDAGIKFGTLYVDPPWNYDNKSTRGAAEDHYKVMTMSDLRSLPIDALAGEMAHLHLWTTNAFIFEAKELLDAWGFEYKGIFVWVKPQMGMGNYWRVSQEYLLLGVRGGQRFMRHDLMSWGKYPRGKHSAKPEEVRDLIVKAGLAPRLELFGRKPIYGGSWIVWGNEIKREDFDIMWEGALNDPEKRNVQTEFSRRRARQEGHHTLFE